MTLLLEFIGAIAILVPFSLLQAGRTTPRAASYLWLNLLGSLLLVYVAWIERQWGFVILQAVWALVAAWGLVARGRRSGSPGDRTGPGEGQRVDGS